MASMRDIKRRKGSIQSTQQITKAMKLVSTVKLQRAKTRAERSKAYFQCMYDTMNSMLAKVGESDHPYLKSSGNGKKAVVLITSNRGLAGGYNSNAIKLITKGDFKKEELVIYAVGKKGRDTLSRYGYEIRADYSDMIEDPQYPDAMVLCNRLLQDFTNGEISEIYLVYTAFKNTVSHEPILRKLLPVEAQEKEEASTEDRAPMNFEPEDEEALKLIIPKYVTSMVYGGMVESAASENGARMQAMDSATSNAEEMIENLTLLYNRARQGSITQELTEIIAGAEAIS
ncbi:MAG: ATP synthase F1 subunit gamma [Lachnospiraceae bacterium]|nr:ATP synthase F1 subunit gamma [Lachnospiraceae bacterium]MDD7148530.1 ATP synthase F1 subunit gamma [Lachnospiraceae bacterium]MDY4068608.1 ATP synthase F1 subunit gamma [Lachnospiraceae bacterium]